MANDIQDVLQDFTLECFNGLDLYEVSQLSDDELKAQLKTYYENQVATAAASESDEASEDLTEVVSEQITDTLKKLTDYLRDMQDGIEESQDSSDLSAVVASGRSQKIADELQAFIEGPASNLSAKTTEVILPYITHLGGTVVESAEDEYFTYDTSDANVIYGGEVIRYNLTATASDNLLTPDENFGDTNSDGVTDFDANGDGVTDLKDQSNEMPYDLSGQELYVEIPDGDKIASASWDGSNKILSLEIETIARSVPGENGAVELSPKTFMLEISIADLEASHIILQGENYGGAEVFSGLDTEILDLIYDNDSTDPLSHTLAADALTPALDAQLAALPGYSDSINNIAKSVSTIRTGLTDTESECTLPADAESILTEMFTAVFDNTSVNSYSEFTRDEGRDKFYEILDRYPAEEQAGLAMAFFHAFIKTDPEQCEALMFADAAKLQSIINRGQSNDVEPDAMQKAIHTLIELTMGQGLYSGDGASGSLLTRGTAYATAKGTEGIWKDHTSSAAALQFLIDDEFDISGEMSQTLDYENGLAGGEISTTAALNIQAQLVELTNPQGPYKYWEGTALSKKEWDTAILYLKNHLITKDGALVDNPLKVFKNCMNKFFKNDDGTWNSAADNFAAGFLAACDYNGAGDLSATLMQGPYGQDIAKYLWNDICDNGADKPALYEVAKGYKNMILKS